MNPNYVNVTWKKVGFTAIDSNSDILVFTSIGFIYGGRCIKKWKVKIITLKIMIFYQDYVYAKHDINYIKINTFFNY